ncbi:MAPEG family protein [Sphingorhabdus sp. Alg239-R122]|uniref:MAPEG family protein n=1 Tax=Sphingorhabdus sp. Alg239-R122 TaxID=2305989 RepID=UPI0013D970B3|nr:MAPEG family protein [Sphingorhabdus sp. Alg239-R122]
MNTALLLPAAVLVLWSLLMLFWMAGTRLPALKKMGVDLGSAPPGGRGQEIDPTLPPQVAWKSHNYTHLMEQPTIFYATVIILTIAGATSVLMEGLAWGYVILRIIHSVWQATVNKINIRFLLFVAATLCLLVLAFSAVIATMDKAT